MIYQALLFTEERLPAEVIRSSETAMEFLDPETGVSCPFSTTFSPRLILSARVVESKAFAFSERQPVTDQ